MLAFPRGSVSKKNLPVSCKRPPARDMGSIPGLWRSPGGGDGNPLQYSCLGNPIDRGTWRAKVHGVARVGHDLETKPPPPFCFYPSPLKLHCISHHRGRLSCCFQSLVGASRVSRRLPQPTGLSLFYSNRGGEGAGAGGTSPSGIQPESGAPVCSNLQNPKSKWLKSRAPSQRPSAVSHPDSFPLPQLGGHWPGGGEGQRGKRQITLSFCVTPGLQLWSSKTQELNVARLLGATKTCV